MPLIKNGWFVMRLMFSHQFSSPGFIYTGAERLPSLYHKRVDNRVHMYSHMHALGPVASCGHSNTGRHSSQLSAHCAFLYRSISLVLCMKFEA